MLSQEQLSLYFQRIGFDTTQETHLPLVPSLQLLQRIQVLQLTSIPYENLSLHWRPVVQQVSSADGSHCQSHEQKEGPAFLSPPFGLSTGELFEKLVVNRRGGYCLELNILLGEALLALGFEVVHAKAKVVFDYEHLSENLLREAAGGYNELEVRALESFKSADSFGWETHQMLLVRITSIVEGVAIKEKTKQYLVDVGLAKYSFLDPIELSSDSQTIGADSNNDTSQEQGSQGRGVMGKCFRLSRNRNSNNSDYDNGVRWNLSVRMSNSSQIWFPYYTFLEKEASVAQTLQIHFYMSRSPTSTSPPEPFSTIPLIHPSSSNNTSSAGVREVEVVGQASMQGMKLTIQHGPRYYSEPGRDRNGQEIFLAKDEEEQRLFFRKYFGIEGYKDGAVRVLADDQSMADGW
ncbi:N-terminal acetyltransferase [Linnemannia zychae]|nr:N-terminal acetyltransferase [Linnemannia zychae]